MTIEFAIPGLRLHSLNAREHWRVKAKRVKAEKEMTKSALWDALPAGLTVIKAIDSLIGIGHRLEYSGGAVTMTRMGPRKLDSDNAVGACKHVRDQIAASIGIDDGDPRITWNVEQAKGPFGVRVRIETKEET